MSKVSELTHDEIAELGARWLKRNGYPFAISNYTDAIDTELPDAIGFTAYGDSFLLEAKVSVSDFKSDFKKRHRQQGVKAYGDRRGYITPEGLLDPNDIPYGWWLLEVYGKNKPYVKVVKGVTKERRKGLVARNGDFREFNGYKFENTRSPTSIFLKLINRAIDDGIDMEKYANGKFRGGYSLEKQES